MNHSNKNTWHSKSAVYIRQSIEIEILRMNLNLNNLLSKKKKKNVNPMFNEQNLRKTVPLVNGKAKCLCKPPSNFFAGGKGPFPFG